MTNPTQQFEGRLARRELMLGAVTVALFGVGGCADKKKGTKKPESPGKALSSGVSSLKKRMKKHVADKDRRDAALALLEDAESNIQRFVELIDESRDARVRLPVAEQTEERLLAIVEEYDGKLRDNLLEACQHAVDVRTHVTAQEWPLVFPPPKAKKGAAT